MHVLAMQMDPAGQFMSVTQPTQVFADVSQTRPFAGSQSVSSVHPTPHVFLVGSQYWPTGQVSFEGRQPTQSPFDVSQTSAAGFPAQSASDVHSGAPPVPEEVVMEPLLEAELLPPLLVDIPPAPPVPEAVPSSSSSPPELEVVLPPPQEAATTTATETLAASATFARSQEDGDPKERKRSAILTSPKRVFARPRAIMTGLL
jgi:hypothetical protein